ncbi:protein kinase [Streptomyces sp. NPDC088752]|uniref:protein kinase domain-containing protein n=1 Tax=Streptomyces sp. NPDC088752 TaxID=3154963 RepID=UPI00343BB557
MDARPHMQSIGNDRYALQHELGRGGMASVYLAHDAVLDRSVAVKLLHPELSHDPSFRARFRREAQTVAKLNHPNIVSVFDSGEEVVDRRHVHYIVMEYVEGQSLRDLLHSGPAGRAVSTQEALDLTSEILLALQASHELGLVHRDVKPANVMVTPRGTVKVMDFGIARALQSPSAAMTQTGAIVGTPQYLSPEQALGREVDTRSDLYSAGCLLFELLTGIVPFDGDSALTIAYAHVQEIPRAPSMLNPSVPRVVDGIVYRAMQKDPAARFPDASSMLRAVNEAKSSVSFGPIIHDVPPLHGTNPLAPTLHATAYPPPVSSQHSFHPSAVRRPSKTTPLLATVAVMLLGAAAWAFLPQRGSADRNPGADSTPTASSSETVSDTPSDKPSPTPSADPSAVRSGSPALTMSLSECQQEPLQDGSVPVPFFKLKHIESARKCASAGGWSLVEKKQNEKLWGKDIIVNQDPLGSFVDKSNRVVTIWVSTGHE